MTIMFDTPTDFFAGSFTYSAMLTFDAYDGDNHLLTTFYSSTGSNLGSHEYLSLNLDGISKITIGGAWYGFSFTMDDMQFNGPQAVADNWSPAGGAPPCGSGTSPCHRRLPARALPQSGPRGNHGAAMPRAYFPTPSSIPRFQERRCGLRASASSCRRQLQ